MNGIMLIFHPVTTEDVSQPVYAVVQKKPKDHPKEERSSGDMISQTTGSAKIYFLIHFFPFLGESPLFHLIKLSRQSPLS